MAAAMAIPAVASSLSQAQGPPEHSSIRLQYSDYQDYQSNQDRISIKSPMLWVDTAIGEKTEFEGSLVLDSISGASPLYLDTVSGASGTGIEDSRKAASGLITQYFDSFSLGIGGVFSTEDDYESRGLNLETSLWTPSKNTTFNFGIAANRDDITSSNNAEINESRTTFNFLAGISQILNSRSLIQTNFTFSGGNGYFSDPYKLNDNRPQSRNLGAILTQYILYFPAEDFSLHVDYRFSHDSWGLNSNMFEFSIYKPLAKKWLVRPSLRYYTQNAADFFQDSYPPRDLNQFYSADQRLASFGGITTSFMIQRDLSQGFTVDLELGFLQQRSNFRPGGGSDNISPFYARFFTIGLTKTF